jgi:RalA-binding protein 1
MLTCRREQQGGSKLGDIDVTGAQIGRQQNQKEVQQSGDSYRHAFLVRECRRTPDGKKTEAGEVDHILCAESDAERDAWVKVLAAWHTGEYVQPPDLPTSSSSSARAPLSDEADRASSSQAGPSKQKLKKVSKDDIARGPAQPIASMQLDSNNAKLFNGPTYQDPPPPAMKHRREESAGRASVTSSAAGTEHEEGTSTAKHHHLGRRRNDMSEIPPSSSLPTNLDTIANSGPIQPPFVRPSSEMGHHSSDSAHSRTGTGLPAHPPEGQSTARPTSPDKRMNAKISGPMNPAPIGIGFKQNKAEERRVKTKSSFWNFAARNERHPAVVAAQPRPVFGVPLQEAVNVARVKEGFDLPAVIYRCVEYLEANNAQEEEGLYRLSCVIGGFYLRTADDGLVARPLSSKASRIASITVRLSRELRHSLTSALQRAMSTY